ncbi:hypothetical protein BGZ94_009414 [Podila epigama]|nr:hypothetical protein BGZ94_009414 [Podila epigama]
MDTSTYSELSPRILPPEVIEQILGHLYQFDQLRCMHVCRLWKQLLEPLAFREYDLSLHPTTQPPPLKHHIRALTVRKSVEDMDAIPRFLFNADVDAFTPQYPTPILLCPKLDSLEIQPQQPFNQSFIRLVSLLPQLTRLTLSAVSKYLDLADLVLLFTAAPNLLYLDLRIDRITDSSDMSATPMTVSAGTATHAHVNLDVRPFPLQSFTLQVRLFKLVNPALLLPMLPHLRDLKILSDILPALNLYESLFYDPLNFAKTVHQFCPNIERYSIINWVPHCLFLPASIASTTGHVSSTLLLPGSIENVYSSEVVPVIPNLKRLILSDSSLVPLGPESGSAMMSAQDLNNIHRFKDLVHLNISQLRGVIQETARLSRLGQQGVSGCDILRVLETCPKLQVFRAEGRLIRYDDLVSRARLSTSYDECHGESAVTPWAKSSSDGVGAPCTADQVAAPFTEEDDLVAGIVLWSGLDDHMDAARDIFPRRDTVSVPK